MRIFLLCLIMVFTMRVQASLTEYQSAVRNEPGLISYYTFDSSSAADSKSSNNGTAQGTVAYDTGVGHGSDKALILKGTGHINLGAVDAFDFASGSGAVEAWIRADWTSNPGLNPAVFADRDGGPVNWSIHMNAGKDAIGMWNGTSYEALTIPGGAGTAWHHFVVVFDIDANTGQPVFTEYWDGKLLGTTSQAIGISPEAPTELGSSSVDGAERWRGALDEVAFYSAPLTAAAVKAHYNAFLVGDPPSILTQPQGGLFLAGVPLTLSVDAKGAQLTYQWSKNGAIIPGATNSSLSFAQLAAGDAGSYDVTVVNSAGQVKSAAATIQIGTLSSKLEKYQTAVRAEASLVSYYTFDAVSAKDSKDSHDGTPQGKIQFGEGIGGGAGKALVLDGSGHVNLGQVDMFDFASGSGTIEAWVRADWTAGIGYNPAIFADRDGGSVNWSIHMNDAKDAVGLWNGSTYEPQPTPGTGTAWHHLAVVFDIDPATSGNTFTVYWDGQAAGTSAQAIGASPESPTELGSSATGGAERWVGALDEVAFYSSALSADAIQAHYTAFITGTPPVITTQPRGGSYFVGGSATLSVGTQGLNLGYQWFKNDTAIAGATNPTLIFPALTSDDGGAYSVKVSNADGSVQSDKASITIVVPNIASYQQAVRAESSLVSYYTFDSGNASDSKSSHDGTPADSVSFGTGVGGGADQALVLDGSGHVDLGQVDAFDFASGSGTVEAWIRADWTAAPNYNPAIFADRDGTPVNWSIHMNAGKEAAGLWNGSSYTPLPLVGTGTAWHHLAVVFDRDAASGASSFTLYWDGAMAGATTQGLGTNPESPTELGASGSLGSEPWIGALDEVAFYSTALSADSIQHHYLAIAGGSNAEKPALSITRNAAQITISWPANVAGYVLESSPNLPATSWTPVSNTAGNTVTVNASSGIGFYRLRKP